MREKKIFKTEYNIPVFSSDECVRGIYRHNVDLNSFIKDEILVSDNEFSNEDIANIVFKDSIKLEKLENYIHPLVKIERDNFINQELNKKSKLVVIEVPLLFEKNLEHEFDKIILVDVTENIQEKRALLRKNMSKEKYLAIKANQIPNSEKINRSDFIINNQDEAKTRDHIEKIVKELNKLVSI